MADWLRWMSTGEVRYEEEPVTLVRKRAKQLVPLFTPIAQGTPVPLVEAQKIAKLLKARITDPVARATLAEEVLCIAGRSFTRREAKLLACRVAGGVAQAKLGHAPMVMSTDGRAYDCLMTVVNVLEGEQIGGEATTVLRFVVGNGPYCASEVDLQFRLSSLRRVARSFELLGKRARVEIRDPRLLLDIQCVGRLERDQGVVSCLGVAVPPKFADYNRSLTRGRFRKLTACVFGGDHDCLQCEVGRNQCNRSMKLEQTFYKLEPV